MKPFAVVWGLAWMPHLGQPRPAPARACSAEIWRGCPGRWNPTMEKRWRRTEQKIPPKPWNSDAMSCASRARTSSDLDKVLSTSLRVFPGFLGSGHTSTPYPAELEGKRAEKVNTKSRPADVTLVNAERISIASWMLATYAETQPMQPAQRSSRRPTRFRPAPQDKLFYARAFRAC
jgi:hypothetical protein